MTPRQVRSTSSSMVLRDRSLAVRFGRVPEVHLPAVHERGHQPLPHRHVGDRAGQGRAQAPREGQSAPRRPPGRCRRGQAPGEPDDPDEGAGHRREVGGAGQDTAGGVDDDPGVSITQHGGRGPLRDPDGDGAPEAAVQR